MRLLLLTGFLQSEFNCWIVILLLLESQDFPLPVSFPHLLFDLSLCLPVQPKQTRAQRLMQPQEDVPVVVDVEEVIGIVTSTQLLRRCVAEQQLRLGRAPAAGDAIVLFGGAFLQIHLLLFLLLLYI